jgi:acetyltransferase-like isoleucine patch superfamily enzyme
MTCVYLAPKVHRRLPWCNRFLSPLGRLAMERANPVSLAQALLTRFRLRRVARCGREVRVLGRLWVRGLGDVRVGDETQFDCGVAGIELDAIDKNARIVIGMDCRLGEGVSIVACQLVQLGDHVAVGPWSKILDNNFHLVRGDRRKRPPSRPVVIEDNVVIGSRVIILPGVCIQEGARIADGAVVSRRVGAGTMVAGNPAKLVRLE